MPITTDSLNKKLYSLLKVQGYDPVPKNSKGETTPVPDDADVFRFTFKVDGKPIGPAWITVDSNQELKVYYDDSLMSAGSDDKDPNSVDSFTDFLKQLKQWAQRRQLGFDLENQDHLESDMAQREHVKKQEQINEGYYPMGKSASYNDSVPSVKIILQHTRQIQEGEQRFRNIARIFLENTVGERILAPTTRPGIAKVYARHLAEGGLPHDDRWNHVTSLVEEYTKMAGFVRATRGNQFNESAQQLVNEGINHYQSLRETLSKMTGHRGYNAYFESYTPALMEDETDTDTLNELFVQETMDPRIESVMPILSRLHKKVNEMSEVKSLEEWAESLINEKMVMGSSSDASASGSYKMGEATDEYSIPEDDLDEGLGDVAKKVGGALKKVGQKALTTLGHGSDEDLKKDLQKKMGIPPHAQHGKKRMAVPNDEHLGESADVLSGMTDILKVAASRQVPQNPQQFAKQVADVSYRLTQNPATQKYASYLNDLSSEAMAIATGKAEYTPQFGSMVHSVLGPAVRTYQERPSTAVAEDLGPEQKRVGQLGPTEKITKSNPTRGKLVGANENFINTVDQAVVTEMDSEGYKGTRDDYEIGKGKEGKGKPVKAKDAAKDAEKVLNKAMDKDHKKPVKEGQEDLEAILRIIRK